MRASSGSVTSSPAFTVTVARTLSVRSPAVTVRSSHARISVSARIRGLLATQLLQLPFVSLCAPARELPARQRCSIVSAPAVDVRDSVQLVHELADALVHRG